MRLRDLPFAAFGGAGAVLSAGCLPLPVPLPTPTAAQLDHIVMVLAFDCSDAGTVSARVTGTRIVLSTGTGEKVFTGAYPTYVGHESSISFSAEYGSFVLAGADDEEICVLASTGRMA
ncbi:MAG: hypothetical protein IT534_06225 [Bauldia sp.]|nr:hypothetical protein [Bauldia sp.]